MKRFAMLALAVALVGAACSKKAEEAVKDGVKASAADDAALFNEPFVEQGVLPKDIKWLTNDKDPVFASPQAKKGGTFYTYMLSFPLTLRTVGPDSNGAFRSFLLDNQMGALSLHPETGNIVPALATHWAAGKDQKTLYLKLDPRARWSDGVPVTALDFAFALKFYRSKDIVAPWYNTYYEEKFEKVVVFDDHTFALVGKERKNLMDMAYYYAIGPRARHFHKLDKDWVRDYNWKIEPNTGPYKVTKVEKGKYVIFKRKPDWWAKDLKYMRNRFNVDKVKISVIRDRNIAWEHFKKGKIDTFDLVIPDYWHKKSNIPMFEKGYAHKLWFYHDRPQPVTALYMNQALDMFKDRDVRIAFAYAMNVDKVLKTVLRGDYDRLHTNTLGHGKFYNEKIRARPFDLQKAEAHLVKAGWGKRGADGIRVKDGKRLSARVTYGVPHHTDRLVILKEEAKKAGIELTLQLLDSASSFKSMLEKQHEIAYTGWGAQDRMQYWGQYHSVNASKPQTNNFSNTADPKLDKLIEAYRSEFSQEKKQALAREIQQVLHDEVYYIPLYAAPYIRTGYWRWVKLPDPPATKHSKDMFVYPFDGDWGGTYWIDEETRKETEAAMKAGKTFEAVTIVDKRNKKG
ncbi:MAG: extracellular solute-binding protein [Elusimicrobiota bacterium]